MLAIHPQARTTPAVRAEIARSHESSGVLAKRYGVSTYQPGPERKDDRQIVSSILHVPTSGCRWRNCPAEYGSRTTVYNRFNRWYRRGFWEAMLTARCPRPDGLTTQQPSIAPMCGPTALFTAAKGGESTGHRSVARRSDDQNPRAHRCPRPPRRPASDSRQRQRREDRARGVGRSARPDPASGCRQELRCRLAAHRPAGAGHHAGHPG